MQCFCSVSRWRWSSSTCRHWLVVASDACPRLSCTGRRSTCWSAICEPALWRSQWAAPLKIPFTICCSAARVSGLRGRPMGRSSAGCLRQARARPADHARGDSAQARPSLRNVVASGTASQLQTDAGWRCCTSPLRTPVRQIEPVLDEVDPHMRSRQIAGGYCRASGNTARPPHTVGARHDCKLASPANLLLTGEVSLVPRRPVCGARIGHDQCRHVDDPTHRGRCRQHMHRLRSAEQHRSDRDIVTRRRFQQVI